VRARIGCLSVFAIVVISGCGGGGASYTARIMAVVPVDPSTVDITVQVSNTSQEAGSPDCMIKVSSAEGASIGGAEWTAPNPLQARAVESFTATVALTKVVSGYVTNADSTVSCS
jgi:ABC-type uncharacterized transport system auxiliary subunit